MENIQVALRVRPLNGKELQRGEENAWNITQDNTITIYQNYSKELTPMKKSGPMNRSSFSFDHAFSSQSNNLQIYNSVVKRIALSSLNGINGTIFMYGQTGSGKTYTMMGYKNEDNDTLCPNNMGLLYNENSPSSPRIINTVNSMKILAQENEKSPNENYLTDNYLDTYEKPCFLNNDSGSTGILIHALRDIFDTIENDLDKTYFLRCSYVEIYNDQIYDLLNSPERLGETLTVNEDNKKEFYIKGLTEESVSSISEILDMLRRGEVNRHYAATMMNHSSSRSHTIFRLLVQTVSNNFIRDYRREFGKKESNINNDDIKIRLANNAGVEPKINPIGNGFIEETLKKEGTMVTESLLNFVDLAGSEKVSNHHMINDDMSNKEFSLSDGTFHIKESLTRSASIKDRVKEGQFINKSLFFLTQVISLKSEGKSSQHIPYRNSPLTKILRSSLGGNSRTLIILCMTPALSQLEQSISTLRFGMNAKKIENKVQANIITNNDDEALKILISDYEKKIRDFESNKQEEQQRNIVLIKQIDELQKQKAKLIEKFGNLCKFQLANLAQNIPKHEVKEFLDQARNKLLYFNNVGLLFNSSTLKKYDHSCGTTITTTSPMNPNQINHDDIDGSIDYNQQLIYDSQGKYALMAYKSIKNQNSVLIKKIKTLEESFKELVKMYLDKYEKTIDYQNIADLRGKKLIQYANLYCDMLDDNSRLQKQIDLYKNLEGIQALTDLQLIELERHFFEKIDQIKSERVMRQYKSEINNLRSQLNMSMIDNKQKVNIYEKNELSKVNVKSELQDLALDLTNSVNLDCIPSKADYKNMKILSLQKEEEMIWNEYNSLISPIDNEIEVASRIAEDNNINICIVPKIDQNLQEAKPTKLKKSTENCYQLDIGASLIDYHTDVEKYLTISNNSIKTINQRESNKANKIPETTGVDLLSLQDNENLLNIYCQAQSKINNVNESNLERISTGRKLSLKNMSRCHNKVGSIDNAEKILKSSAEKCTTKKMRRDNSKENINSSSSLMKKDLFKPLLNKNSSNKAISTNTNNNNTNSRQPENNELTPKKPLGISNLNAINHNASKNLNTQINSGRSKTPISLSYQLNLKLKDITPLRSRLSKSKKSSASQSNKLVEIINSCRAVDDENRVTKYTNISFDNKDCGNDYQCLTERLEYNTPICELKINKENCYEPPNHLDLYLSGMDATERDEIQFTNSLYLPKRFERIESNESVNNIIKTTLGLSSSQNRHNFSEFSPSRRDELIEFYQQQQQQYNEQELRKRRSRADRSSKTKA